MAYKGIVAHSCSCCYVEILFLRDVLMKAIYISKMQTKQMLEWFLTFLSRSAVNLSIIFMTDHKKSELRLASNSLHCVRASDVRSFSIRICNTGHE